MNIANPLNAKTNINRSLLVNNTGNPTAVSGVAKLRPVTQQPLALRQPATNLVEPRKTAGFVNNMLTAVKNIHRFAVDPQRETNRYAEGALDHLQSSGQLGKIVKNVSSDAGSSAVSAGLSKLKEKMDGGVNNIMGYAADAADGLHPVVGNFIRQHPYLSAGGLATAAGATIYNMPKILSALSLLQRKDDEENESRPKLKLEGSADVRKRLQDIRERLRSRRR
jgi:hypothetical protein